MIYVIELNECKYESTIAFVDAGPEFEVWFNDVFLPWFRTMEISSKKWFAGEPFIVVVGDIRSTGGSASIIETVEQLRENHRFRDCNPPIPEFVAAKSSP